MNFQLDAKAIFRWAAKLILASAVIVYALFADRADERMGTFAEDLALFTVQAILITATGLAATYVAQAVRASQWYDRNGAGTEIATIRDRIDTENEQPMDGIAVAVQYAATTVFLATILLAFFLMHAGG